MKKLILLSIGTFLLISLFSGCAHKPEKEDTAGMLAEKGMAEFEKEHYKKALDIFERLRDWYPFSKHAVLAELKIADAYFQMEQYTEAVSSYEMFERLHPKNEAIPRVIYRIGLCHYRRLDTIDRDQTPAKNAIEAFSRLQKQYPDSQYAELAQKHIHHCRKSLAGHHLYVGKFYFQSEHYQAALERFKQVTEKYSEVGDTKTANHYIRLCRKKLEQAPDKKKQ